MTQGEGFSVLSSQLGKAVREKRGQGRVRSFNPRQLNGVGAQHRLHEGWEVRERARKREL